MFKSRLQKYGNFLIDNAIEIKKIIRPSPPRPQASGEEGRMSFGRGWGSPLITSLQ